MHHVCSMFVVASNILITTNRFYAFFFPKGNKLLRLPVCLYMILCFILSIFSTKKGKSINTYLESVKGHELLELREAYRQCH